MLILSIRNCDQCKTRMWWWYWSMTSNRAKMKVFNVFYTWNILYIHSLHSNYNYHKWFYCSDRPEYCLSSTNKQTGKYRWLIATHDSQWNNTIQGTRGNKFKTLSPHFIYKWSGDQRKSIIPPNNHSKKQRTFMFIGAAVVHWLCCVIIFCN